MLLNFLPHVEVPWLSKKQPVGHIAKALQCGVDEVRGDPSPIPSHKKTTIKGLSILKKQWTIQKVNVELIHRVTRKGIFQWS